MTTRPARRPAAGAAATVVAALLALALVTWAVALWRMRGMDDGPGTDLGAVAPFVGLWVTMTAAMMLPSTLPMAVTVRAAAEGRGGRTPSAVVLALFTAGYLLAWTAYGLAVWGALHLLAAHHPTALAWDRQGPLVAGAAVALAGAYQLTPLKRACLRHCRTPLAFVMRRWRPGPAGAVAMGLEHGAWCLGCCIGLMLALLAVGVMGLAWMAVVAAAIFAEKVLPGGARLTAPIAVCLIALGALIAVAPGRVPGLTQPGGGMAMERHPPA
jgi:predicted metal-binding membrane protein